MERLLLLALILANLQMQAQVCEPDPQYASETIGVYPPPDSVGSLTTALDIAYKGRMYEMVMTAIVPDSIAFEINPGDPNTLTNFDLVKIILDTITGLPEGLTYTCEPADCIFPDQKGGCVLISGTPTADFGAYSMTVDTRVDIKQAILPVTFPGTTFSGEYKIMVEEYVGLNIPMKEPIRMEQNVPNPFSTDTDIAINSSQSGKFTFKVYNLLGKEVYQEKILLSAGNNVFKFNANQLYSGLYFYAIVQKGNNLTTKRMVVHRP